MDLEQGARPVGPHASPAEIAELIGIWGPLSGARRQAVIAFARMIAREPEPPADQRVQVAA